MRVTVLPLIEILTVYILLDAEACWKLTLRLISPSPSPFTCHHRALLAIVLFAIRCQAVITWIVTCRLFTPPQKFPLSPSKIIPGCTAKPRVSECDSLSSYRMGF
jgi:hypothetical protein